MENLLEIEKLKVEFFVKKNWVTAVDDVSFFVKKKEIFGFVGESGSGKSTIGLSILNILDRENSRISSNRFMFEDIDLMNLKEKDFIKLRGNKISMIFQDPMTSLNPVLKVGDQIGESLILHKKMTKKEARKKTLELMELVSIPNFEKKIDDYPSSLSGGIRQRIMIAMALCCDPKLLIADEPTTALDVTIQAEILSLIKKLKDEIGMSVIFITHDLGVVSEICERIAVLYCGKIVELGKTENILRNPSHPYTFGLLKSIPKIGKKDKNERLYTIKGNVPLLSDLPKGCYFQNRCDFSNEKCFIETPNLEQISDEKYVACFNTLDKNGK